MEDNYQTLIEETQSYIKEKGSKFYGYAFPVENLEDFGDRLKALKKEHHKASHHCFAYRIGDQEILFRSSDDGEPTGTAGAPILGQIDSFGLTDTGVIVVRYFGGTKLGASGLIKSYRLSAKEALMQSKITTKIRTSKITFSLEYFHLNQVMAFIKDYNIEIYNQNMHEKAQLTVKVPKSQVNDIIIDLKALLGEEYRENIDLNTSINGFKIESIF